MMLIKKLSAIIFIWMLSFHTFAISLSDLYFLAVKNDPTFNLLR